MAPRATTTDDSSTDSPFQQAFKAAKAQLAEAADADDTTDEDTREAGADADSDEDPDADASEDADDSDDDAEGDDEASTDDEDEEDDAEADEGESADGEDTEEPEDTHGLLSEQEFTALQTKYADDPIQLRKELEKAFTQKTQSLSERRRRVERFEQYGDLLDAYEADPAGTVKALAKQLGITELEAKAQITEPTEAERKKAEADREQALLDSFRTKLGPEFEYLAEGLLPAVKALVSELAAGIVDEKTKPIREGTERIVTTAANAETDRVMAAFAKTHPDWQTHEPAMTAMMDRFPPPPDRSMTEEDYLDHIYTMVTAEALRKDFDKKVKTAAAKQAKAAVAKLGKSARNAGSRRSAPADEEVTAGPPHGQVEFKDAASAAKRGERWDFTTGAPQ